MNTVKDLEMNLSSNDPDIKQHISQIDTNSQISLANKQCINIQIENKNKKYDKKAYLTTNKKN